MKGARRKGRFSNVWQGRTFAWRIMLARRATGAAQIAMRYVTHYLRATTQEIAGMKRGPKPFGDHTMTAAERQARYRTAHADGARAARRLRRCLRQDLTAPLCVAFRRCRDEGRQSARPAGRIRTRLRRVEQRARQGKRGSWYTITMVYGHQSISLCHDREVSRPDRS